MDGVNGKKQSPEWPLMDSRIAHCSSCPETSIVDYLAVHGLFGGAEAAQTWEVVLALFWAFNGPRLRVHRLF